MCEKEKKVKERPSEEFGLFLLMENIYCCLWQFFIGCVFVLVVFLYRFFFLLFLLQDHMLAIYCKYCWFVYCL